VNWDARGRATKYLLMQKRRGGRGEGLFKVRRKIMNPCVKVRERQKPQREEDVAGTELIQLSTTRGRQRHPIGRRRDYLVLPEKGRGEEINA